MSQPSESGALRARGAAVPRHHATSSQFGFSAEELDFLRAMDDYKRRTGHPFPTWTEALAVLKGMGYRREP